jgi:hypothetical protein
MFTRGLLLAAGAVGIGVVGSKSVDRMTGASPGEGSATFTIVSPAVRFHAPGSKAGALPDAGVKRLPYGTLVDGQGNTVGDFTTSLMPGSGSDIAVQRFVCGATSGAGVSGTGGPASYGGAFTGGTTGAGVLGQGGATNGLGGYFNGGGTNGGGIYVDGRGTGVAITAVARDGYGASIESDATSPVKAALHIEPQDAEPTGPNAVGDIYVTTAGVLKICTVAGTPGTWVSVGAQ